MPLTYTLGYSRLVWPIPFQARSVSNFFLPICHVRDRKNSSLTHDRTDRDRHFYSLCYLQCSFE